MGIAESGSETGGRGVSTPHPPAVGHIRGLFAESGPPLPTGLVRVWINIRVRVRCRVRVGVRVKSQG